MRHLNIPTAHDPQEEGARTMQVEPIARKAEV